MDTHYTYRSHKHIHMCIYVYEFLDKCISNYSPRNTLIQMTSIDPISKYHHIGS